MKRAALAGARSARRASTRSAPAVAELPSRTRPGRRRARCTAREDAVSVELEVDPDRCPTSGSACCRRSPVESPGGEVRSSRCRSLSPDVARARAGRRSGGDRRGRRRRAGDHGGAASRPGLLAASRWRAACRAAVERHGPTRHADHSALGLGAPLTRSGVSTGATGRRAPAGRWSRVDRAGIVPGGPCWWSGAGQRRRATRLVLVHGRPRDRPRAGRTGARLRRRP